MDPYGSVWSLRTPWGLPGASWGPGGPKKGGKGVLTPGGAGEALLGGLPISPSWANKPPISLRGILTYLREFVNYRHPDPRRGEPRVCSTQLDAFPVESSGK